MDYLFKEKKGSVRTILSYKSPIAFYWKLQVGYEIPESNTAISDLVRSFKGELPIPVKYEVEWDVQLVLEYFKSEGVLDWKQLSDKDITLKTVFLLALATGKKRSEIQIHALSRNVRWLSGDVRMVEISPVSSFMSKTHVSINGPGALRPITLSALPESQEEEVGDGDQLLCPVRTLEAYMNRSSEHRSDKKTYHLLPEGFCSGYIETDNIWIHIKEAILLAYSNASQANIPSPVHVKPHSVRHVATSLSPLRTFSLNEVLRAGAWSSPNVFIKHYVQNFSTDDMSK